MILADTSVWIDHFRQGNAELVELLETSQIVTHELIIEEIACGNLKARQETVGYLSNLRQLPRASHDELLRLIESRKLYGTGVGAMDVQLMGASLIAGAEIFTLDKNLAKAWELCRPNK
jgi:predicted nucleic acid-binding protein